MIASIASNSFAQTLSPDGTTLTLDNGGMRMSIHVGYWFPDIYAYSTNNKLSGQALVLPIEGQPQAWMGGLISLFELYINETKVSRWPQNPLQAPSANWSTRWDSTHFAAGSPVKYRIRAKFELTDFEGLPTDFTLDYTWPDLIVRNSATLFGRNDLESSIWPSQHGMPIVRDALSQMNIPAPWYRNDKGWTSYAYYGSLEWQTVTYVHTHTSSGVGHRLKSDYDEVWTGPPSDIDPELAEIWPWNVEPGDSIRQRQGYSIGSGFPPLNSTHRPPFVLAFLDACWTGEDNSYAEAYLWPYYNAWGEPICTDQSEAGWAIKAYDLSDVQCMEAFWGALRDGYTVDEARLDLYSEYKDWCDYWSQWDPLIVPNYTTDPRMTLRVWGDWYTRIHGVYTGTSMDSPMSDWYRDGA